MTGFYNSQSCQFVPGKLRILLRGLVYFLHQIHATSIDSESRQLVRRLVFVFRAFRQLLLSLCGACRPYCLFASQEINGLGCSIGDCHTCDKRINRLEFLQMIIRMPYDASIPRIAQSKIDRNPACNLPSNTSNRWGLAYLPFSRNAQRLLGYTHVAFQTPF